MSKKTLSPEEKKAIKAAKKAAKEVPAEVKPAFVHPRDARKSREAAEQAE